MVGKQFKYRLLEGAVPRTVTELRNGFVIFDDGSRIEENRIGDLFEEYTGPGPASNPQIRPKGGLADKTFNMDSLTNESVSTPVTNVDKIDPASFFDQSNAINRLSKTESNPKNIEALRQMGEVTGTRTLESTITEDIETPQEQVRKFAAKRDDYTQQDQKKDGYELPSYTKDGRPINSGTQAYSNTMNEQSNQQQSYNQPSNTGNPLLQQLKRSNKIKFNIELDESIPKPEFIKLMDENFEGGVLDYLVTDMVSKLLKNPSILEKQIGDSLYEIVYGAKKPTRRKTSTKRKTSSKTSTKKSTTAAKKTTTKDDSESVSTKTPNNKEGLSEEDKGSE